MKRVPLTKNFYLDEFIPPEIYSERGEKSVAFLDMRIIHAVQYLRDQLGVSITVNNWADDGHYHESGLRSFKTGTGAKFSQHKYGRAADIKVKGMTPEEVHAFILTKEDFFIVNGCITTMEAVNDTPSWTHIDCRHTGLNKILIVNP